MALDVKISYSWTNYCRLCLLDEGVMTPIFDDEGLKRQIGHKIEACLQLVTYDGDPLPTKICHKCLGKVDRAYEFRTMALNSYERIKSHLLPLKHVPEVEEYLFKAGHLSRMSDLDVASNLASSTRSEVIKPNTPKIRVKTETELMDPQCSSWYTPFSNSSKETPAAETPDTLKRKRFFPPDSTSLEAPQKINLPVSKKSKIKHSSAGPASRKKSWQCVFCLSYFPSKASLNSHLENCLRCSTCLQDFSSFREKVVHEAEHISILANCNASYLKWKCTRCTASFASSLMLSNHSQCHQNETNFEPECESRTGISGIVKIKSKSQKRTKQVNEQGYSEDDCGKSSVILSCSTCNQLFRSNRMLLDHEKIIHGRFRCSSCSEIFDSQKALNSHKRCHVVKPDNKLTKKPLRCTFCYEEFEDEDALVLHLYHHATEQSDDESVPPKKSRKDHDMKKSTTTNGPDNTSFNIKCERCHVVCRSKEYYKVHLATHVSKSKTSFPCSGCLQDFRNVEALNRHTCMNNLRSCLDCGQVEGEEHICDNKCPQCDKVFKSARGQRLHFTSKHGRKVPTENGFCEEPNHNLSESSESEVGNQTEEHENQSEENHITDHVKDRSNDQPFQAPRIEKSKDSSENGQSDTGDWACEDSDASSSLRSSSPVVRLPPDGASIVEPVPEFDLGINDFGQPKTSDNPKDNLEASENDICFKARF